MKHDRWWGGIISTITFTVSGFIQRNVRSYFGRSLENVFGWSLENVFGWSLENKGVSILILINIF
jgi:hypothetical protein